MTFTAYIQRQKSLIRSRRECEREPKRRQEEDVCGYDTEKLIDGLISLKGLNTAERERYSKIFSYEYC